MIEKMKLPEELVSGIGQIRNPKIEKRTLEGIDEIQSLYVSAWSSIKMHGHKDQWEVWVDFDHKTAYVCLKDEKHELVNKIGAPMILMAIKGHKDYSYDDLAEIFQDWGFVVTHGSLLIG